MSSGRFQNVDLDVKSSNELTPLLSALEGQLLAIHVGKLRRKHWVRFELRHQPATPSGAMQGFDKVLDRLPRSLKALLADATKEFDIGIEAGAPAPEEWTLDARAVRIAARWSGSIRITVYPGAPNGGPADGQWA